MQGREKKGLLGGLEIGKEAEGPELGIRIPPSPIPMGGVVISGTGTLTNKQWDIAKSCIFLFNKVGVSNCRFF